MTTFCKNKLTVFGPSKEIPEFVRAAEGREPAWPDATRPTYVEDFCFHSLYPVPEDVIAAGFDEAGYDWCSKFWGTKWGSVQSKIMNWQTNQVTYTYSTAWEPGFSFLKKLSARFPNLYFALSYAETPPRGRLLYKGGELLLNLEEDPPELENEDDSRWEWEYEYYESHPEWVQELIATLL